MSGSFFGWAKLANSKCFLLQPDALADSWSATLTVISTYVLAQHHQWHHWRIPALGKNKSGAGGCSKWCPVRGRWGEQEPAPSLSPIMGRWKSRNSQGSEGNLEVSLRFWNLLLPFRPVQYLKRVVRALSRFSLPYPLYSPCKLNNLECVDFVLEIVCFWAWQLKMMMMANSMYLRKCVYIGFQSSTI